MKVKTLLMVGSALPAALLATPVLAQSGRPLAGASATDGGVAEIVVTATKREQKLNSVPMAITAASGAALTAQGVTQVSQLTKIEPSLQFSPSNNGTPVYTIRGVGYFEQSLAATPAVSIYQDEVPFSFPIMTKAALMDAERVEILKGPQGTLYGQNATGGLINFIAAKPTHTFEAGVQGTYARFNATNLNGYISGPIAPNLYVRLSGQIEQGGAWQRSATRDDKLGDKDTKSARIQLQWEPSDRFKAHLSVNGFVDKSDTQAGQLVGIRFLSPQYISNINPALPSSYLPQPGTVYPAGIQALLASPIPNRNDRAADWDAGTHPHANEKFVQPTLRLDYDVTDAVTLTSLSSYEYYKQDDQHDVDGVSVRDQNLVTRGKVNSFFQEFRAGGKLLGDRATWLLGANYANERSRERDDADDVLLSASYLTGGSAYSLLPLAPWTNYFILNNINAKTLSVFGNVDADIGPAFTLHAGLRYTDSKQNMSGCTGTNDVNLIYFYSFFLPPGSTPAAPGTCTTSLADGTEGLAREKLHQHNVPFHFGIDYKIDPGKLLYVSISRGYKAGTTPAVVPTSYIQRTPVTQESLVAYEAGAKMSLFDRQMQLNGALFYYDYKDKQLLGRVVDPLGIFGALQALVNIPKSREIGFEVSTVVSPRALPGVSLNGAVTYLDSKVTSHFLNFSPYATGASDKTDFYGEPYPYTPKWGVRAGGRYEWRLSEGIRANINASASYQTKMNGAFGAVEASRVGPSLLVKPYAILDVGAGIEAADHRWRVDFWGKNVTNTYYWSSVFYQSDTTVRYTGMPATYGVTASIRFH